VVLAIVGLGLGINYVLRLIERSFTSWKQDVSVGE
jgi:NitT/TauT family transport system permease protein